MKKYGIILIASLAVIACSKQEAEIDVQAPETDLESILVPTDRLALYADLSQYTGKNTPETRASGNSVSLHSLLDNSKKTKMTFEGTKYTQIPFKASASEVPAYYGYDPETPFEEAVITRKFYIKAKEEFIVTMVTGYQYAVTNPKFDYLNKPDYTGVIFFAKLDGTLLGIQTYRSGLIQEGNIMTPEKAEEQDLDAHYIKVATPSPETRAATNTETIDGWNGEPSYCVADRLPWTWTQDIPDPADGTGVIPDNDNSGAGAGGGSSNGGNVSETKYTVSLSTNCPQDVAIVGSGNYTYGSHVNVYSVRKNYVSAAKCEFKRWTGTFASKNTDSFLHKVSGNVNSVAYYDASGPCMDAAKGISNPVEGTMTIAATKSGSYANGLFKADRGKDSSGQQKYHWGIDIAADPGTSIYSIYSGVIVAMFDNAPNYHEERKFGNYVIIESVIDGRKVYFQYSHLQYGKPIAVNPATGKPYKKGDSINAGDQLGYSGKTGNAFDDGEVPNKHLDLMVSYQFNSNEEKLVFHSEIDPLPFLNATIDAASLKKTPFDANKAIMTTKKCN